MAITMMKRGADVDPQSIAQRQALAHELYKNSLTPQQPEQHWAQGLSRVLQSGIAGAQNAGASRDRETYNENRQGDMSKIAQALSGGDYQSILGDLNTPDAQMMALGLAKTEADRKNLLQTKENEYTRDRKDKLTDMGAQFEQKKTLARLKGGATNPTKEIQSRLGGVEDELEGLQNQGAQEQDPMRQKEIQARMQQLNANRENLISRISSSKGKLPKQELTPLNKMFQEQEASDVKGALDSISLQAKTSQDMVNKGNQILQLLAANPNVDGGFGREQLTRIQTVFNNILPGSAPNVGDQQSLQKLVGQLVPETIGKLRESGVSRITQGEILNLVPTITATMANDREGLKEILGLNAALNVPMQEANVFIKKLQDVYRKDPSFNIKGAMEDVEALLSDKIQNASMGFMNKKLMSKGQKLIPNPNYDESNNVLDKYVVVPLNQQ